MKARNGSYPRPALPEGWQWRALADIGTWVGGGTPSKQRGEFWEGGTIPWVSPKDMKHWCLDSTKNAISEAGVAGSSAKVFDANSVAVVVRSGILEHTLPVALVPFEATANQDMRVVTPTDGIDAEWLMYALQADAETIRRACRKDGTTVASIDVPKLTAWTLPVPPLHEQRRISSLVAARTAKIHSGLESLAHARSRLRELTRAAIDAEIRTLLEEACKTETPESLAADVQYGLAIGPFGSNLKVSDYSESGVPLIFVRNIRSRTFGGPGTGHVPAEKARELRAHRVSGGDLLITKMGDPPGDCVVYPATSPDAIITADCIRFVVDRSRARPDFIASLFLSGSVKRQIHERTKGVAQRKISLKTFRTIELPVPDLTRQDQIMIRLDEVRQARADLDRHLGVVRRQATHLNRSMLHAASRGALPR